MKNRTLYVDCFSGIAGDMMLGALLDLGLPRALLENELAKLPIDPPTLRVDRSKRHGIEGTDVHVEVSKESAHSHRTFRDISTMIEKAGFNEVVASTALRIFERLARAEGAVHGNSVRDCPFP